MEKNIEIITLIYKSVDYLNLMVNQFKSDLVKLDGWDVGVRIVANDATEEVIEELKKSGIPYTIYNNPNPNEYYLNRVYRAYNHSVKTSRYHNVCLLNSDNVLSKEWLKNLLKHHDGVNIPCGRLVESGKMNSGLHAINLGQNHFGRDANNINFNDWENFVENVKRDIIKEKGLYGACVFETKRFLESGGYPEGNIYSDGVGTLNGWPIKSSDDYYFHDILESKYGMKHITVFDSLVYHIIEGEKDS